MTHPTDALRLVPVEPTREQELAMQRALLKDYPKVFEGEAYVNGKLLDAIYAAALAAAPASPLPEGVGPHERWGILNHLGGFWTPENFANKREAVAYLDRWKHDNPKMDLSRHKVIPVLVTITAAPTGDARNGKGEG